MSAPLQDAQFVRGAHAGGYRVSLEGEAAQGVTFTCPCGTGHMVLVWFANPIGGEPPAPPETVGPSPRWQRSGETLSDLTLTPSIAIDCWHGWVRGGRIVSA